MPVDLGGRLHGQSPDTTEATLAGLEAFTQIKTLVLDLRSVITTVPMQPRQHLRKVVLIVSNIGGLMPWLNSLCDVVEHLSITCEPRRPLEIIHSSTGGRADCLTFIPPARIFMNLRTLILTLPRDAPRTLDDLPNLQGRKIYLDGVPHATFAATGLRAFLDQCPYLTRLLAHGGADLPRQDAPLSPSCAASLRHFQWSGLLTNDGARQILDWLALLAVSLRTLKV